MNEYQIASAIENYVTSHEGVTNFSVAIDQIQDEVDTLRIRMFDEQDLNSRGTISLEPFLQTIKAKATSRSIDGKDTIVDIPNIHVRRNGKVAIEYCGSPTYKTPFRTVVGNQRLYATHDPIIGNAPLAHYENGRLTFFNTVLKNVMIRAIFVDPSKLVEYDYDSEEDEYPVPLGFADMLIGKTVESYLRTMYRIPVQPNTQTDMPNARS